MKEVLPRSGAWKLHHRDLYRMFDGWSRPGAESIHRINRARSRGRKRQRKKAAQKFKRRAHPWLAYCDFQHSYFGDRRLMTIEFSKQPARVVFDEQRVWRAERG